MIKLERALEEFEALWKKRYVYGFVAYDVDVIFFKESDRQYRLNVNAFTGIKDDIVNFEAVGKEYELAEKIIIEKLKDYFQEGKMTNKEYRKHEGISRSELYVICEKTPLHFKYMQENPKEDTQSLSFGRAAHKLILEPDDFANEFVVSPDFDRRTKAGKEAYEAFAAENADKEIISRGDYEVLTEMKKAVDSNENARKFLNGIHETSYFWTDEETGELCKVRPDCITTIDGKKYIVDYKTTDSCADGHFERSVRKYGYRFQAGMYREGVFQNTFEDYGFAFVAQEKTAPYAVRVYTCSEEFCNEGLDEFKNALRMYHDCKETGNWFGYEGPDGCVTSLFEEDI